MLPPAQIRQHTEVHAVEVRERGETIQSSEGEPDSGSKEGLQLQGGQDKGCQRPPY